MARKSKNTVVLSDSVMNKLLDVRDSLDALDNAIVHEQTLAQSWIDGKARLEELVATHEALYKTWIAAKEAVQENPDYRNSLIRAKAILAKVAHLSDNDQTKASAVALVNKHNDILQSAVQPEYKALLAAEKAMLEQKTHLQSDAKRACYRAWQHLYGGAK